MGREVLYVNVGHTWVGEADRGNRWFASAVWDHPAGRRLRLLGEVYFRIPGVDGDPNRAVVRLKKLVDEGLIGEVGEAHYSRLQVTLALPWRRGNRKGVS